MTRVSKNISLPKWLHDEIKNDKENTSERIRELVYKGLRYEDLQALAGTNKLHRYIADTGQVDKEEGRDGPDGNYTFGGFNYTGGHGQAVPAWRGTGQPTSGVEYSAVVTSARSVL